MKSGMCPIIHILLRNIQSQGLVWTDAEAEQVRPTSKSEVPRLSRLRDWILETWTPISLWIPEHSMQVRIPRLVESHPGSREREREFVTVGPTG